MSIRRDEQKEEKQNGERVRAKVGKRTGKFYF